MSTRVYVPADATACSLGSEQVAAELAALDLDLEIVRNGSRGLYWLEPLLEIETGAGRIGFGNMTASGVTDLFGPGIPDAKHENCLGLVEQIPYLQKQQRLTTARVGIIDPLSLQDYAAHGGLAGLEAARGMAAADIVATVTDSGLRGRLSKHSFF